MKNTKKKPVPKSIRKFIETGKIHTPNTHRHGTRTSIKSGGVKPVLWEYEMLTSANISFGRLDHTAEYNLYSRNKTYIYCFFTVMAENISWYIDHW